MLSKHVNGHRSTCMAIKGQLGLSGLWILGSIGMVCKFGDWGGGIYHSWINLFSFLYLFIICTPEFTAIYLLLANFNCSGLWELLHFCHQFNSYSVNVCNVFFLFAYLSVLYIIIENVRRTLSQNCLHLTQNKGKESENSDQKLKRSL